VNFCDHTKLGFKNAAALEKVHKAVDLKYLLQTKIMAVRLWHDAVFEHLTKETAARNKLHSILQNNEVSKILRGAIDDADDVWIAEPWQISAVQIWGKTCHKYEGMTDMLTRTMMEELANIITCVTGDARQRRNTYEADQDFERFGKTLIANFKDTTTLWAILRTSLRQCHIHKLSKVGRDKAAWAEAEEYLTNLKNSDTIITLENTNDGIKLAQNYIDRQDTDGGKRVAFSSIADVDADNEHDEVKALRAALKDKDQRLLALQAKFDSFSHKPKDGGNKRKKMAKKECNYCKRAGKGFQGHNESGCGHKQKDKAEAKLQAIKERREDKSRQATKSEKKAFAACALVNTGPATQAAGDDQYSKVSYGSYL